MSINSNFFEKLREFITPAYNQSLNAKRLERLNKFFDELKRIQNLKESQRVKTILLDSATVTLSGVKDAKFEELEYFLETSNVDNFEIRYRAFLCNKAGFVISRDESDKISEISSIQMGKVQIKVLNLFLILAMCIWPFVFQMGKTPFINLDITDSIWELCILGISVFCLITVIKILYDWSRWYELNMPLAKQKQSQK